MSSYVAIRSRRYSGTRGIIHNYMEILAHYKARYPFSLYSYVLMSNHVHLLLETQKIPLSKILQGINQSYTIYFNKKYKTVGHLFQGRYKSILCDRDEYLLSLVKYIHHNPVRANMVKEPEKYQWSSHRYYIRRLEKFNIVDTEQVLWMFSGDEVTARKLYRGYMDEGTSLKSEEVYRTVDQRVLGGEEFIEKVMEIYDGGLEKEKRQKEYRLNEIMRCIEQIFGVTLIQIRGRSRKNEVASGRKVLILVAKEYGYAGKEIAKYIKRDPAVVSIALKDSKLLRQDMESVFRLLKSK